MIMSKYKYFTTFLFRTPFFSYEDIKHFKEKWENSSVFKEMLQVASPDLYDSVNEEDNNSEKSVYSSYRYFERACTRCTPFGLFAGCSVGTTGDKTEIFLSDTNDYQRKTRLDMNYICALTQQIEKDRNIRNQLTYYPNTSIYRAGDDLRYVEYVYRGTRRSNRITSVERTDYLEQVLGLAENGASFFSLALSLVDEAEEIYMEDAMEYLHDLIDSQLLVSDLEPAVTNTEPLSTLITKLNRLEIIDKNYLSILESIEKQLSEIDSQPVGDTNDVYPAIVKNIQSTNIQSTNIQSEIKYLFQTDLFKPARYATVNRNIMTDIRETLGFLNKINQYSDQSLSGFKENFTKRYEGREMPLLYLMDSELGIAYKNVSGDISPLLDGIRVIQRNEQESDGNRVLDAFQTMMLQKWQKAFKENSSDIILTDEDVKGAVAHWDDMPPSISVMCQILEDSENKRLFYLKSIGGSSAANLLGRFCHLDDKILQHTLEITSKETELNPDAIYAEIVHLPESRIGNILMRPILRPYEISYLARSEVSKEFEIRLSDLFVSVKNNRVILKSRRLNKEIIPRLSTAHNYRLHAMPVYHFLCDLQHQNGRIGLGFGWGNIAQNFDFLPRVSYKNCILSKARWTVSKKETESLMKIKNDDELLVQINDWLSERNIPKQVLLADGDNVLYVDMQDILSIRSWFAIVKKRNSFQLEEWLFNPETAVVKGESGTFNNEFICAFYKINTK
jgi:hypothetical protein